MLKIRERLKKKGARYFFEDGFECFFIRRGDGGEDEVARFFSVRFVRLADADADARKILGMEMVDDGPDALCPADPPPYARLNSPMGMSLSSWMKMIFFRFASKTRIASCTARPDSFIYTSGRTKIYFPILDIKAIFVGAEFQRGRFRAAVFRRVFRDPFHRKCANIVVGVLEGRVWVSEPDDNVWSILDYYIASSI